MKGQTQNPFPPNAPIRRQRQRESLRARRRPLVVAAGDRRLQQGRPASTQPAAAMPKSDENKGKMRACRYLDPGSSILFTSRATYQIEALEEYCASVQLVLLIRG